MKKILFILTCALGVSSYGQQNITGNWQGILTHPYDTAGYLENYAFFLHVEQEGDSIVGQSRIEMGTSQNFAVWNFKGLFKSGHLAIAEISWEESRMQDGMFINWCQKKINLIYTWEDSTESLRGIWIAFMSDQDCGSGEIYVHRSSKEFNSRTAESHDYITFAEFRSRLKDGQSVKNLRVILPEVTFDAYSSNLLPDSKKKLQELRDILNEYPNIQIDIFGHTGNLGSDQYNLTLSRSRAKVVRAYLSLIGVKESRIRFHGFGESRPVDTNTTEDGRRKNRRIEFEVVSE